MKNGKPDRRGQIILFVIIAAVAVIPAALLTGYLMGTGLTGWPTVLSFFGTVIVIIALAAWILKPWKE
jgi:Na+-driven multidrug efflux pump